MESFSKQIEMPTKPLYGFNRRDVKSLENLIYGTQAFYLRTMIMTKLRKQNVT